LIQAEIVSLKQTADGQWTLESRLHAQYTAPCVVLATGTFLRGRIYVGDQSYESGPDGMFPANALARSLTELNLPLRRFKTGTPARVNRRSVDLRRMEAQPGDESITAFSFFPRHAVKNQVCCHITYTNEETRQVILDNLHLSPMYSGRIEGKGPRYCPSFEDKVVRFPDKERHQLFVEPCGLDTEELYLQGLSSSMPLSVQEAFIHTIPGLEQAQIMRNAYAIEYDCVDPTALTRSLEFPNHPGLFGAGQFNGSSGYEEAAAQGLIAGINAACRVAGKPPFTLDRASSYIGTLIDDLVTKGCTDPYRMMTSRSEYRLILRQDNADVRLTPLGYQVGLISEDRHQAFLKKQELVSLEQKRLQETILPPSQEIQALLASLDSPLLKSGIRLAELMRRPNLGYEALTPIDPGRPDLPREVMEQVEISIKYEGYIRRQAQQIREMRRLEGKRLPPER
ncbi:MAG: tRNA uridine-5-carboxymethylaminomethyl(34) synthesis enzyme MnmG, partial [Clostridiales bacterium]|nr:tRNA uridine-5-carboxymethylaminomethyl(34) synthesis enzyme MnmG [Clostridiales bacterium]